MLTKRQKAYLPFKRLIDILGSFIGIFVCLAFLWWWVFIINVFASKGHPIFVQKRYGKHKRVFNLIKFRTMKYGCDEYMPPFTLSDDKYLSLETKFGKFLRKTSIDETLQLFNILFGAMSFIGPRPGSAKNEEDLVLEREKYSPSAYEVRPGLSGKAQLLKEDLHNPSIKAKADYEYVSNISFGLDIKLFFKTILRIFKRK